MVRNLPFDTVLPANGDSGTSPGEHALIIKTAINNKVKNRAAVRAMMRLYRPMQSTQASVAGSVS